MAKAKPKKPIAKKLDCDVKGTLSCNNQCVRKVTGLMKGDPVFNCCIGCFAYLQRQGVKLKETT